jgi:hypothetical protein
MQARVACGKTTTPSTTRSRTYDDPEGTPKSWSNPADADPDNDDHITRIGGREIEETLIEPAKDKE